MFKFISCSTHISINSFQSLFSKSHHFFRISIYVQMALSTDMSKEIALIVRILICCCLTEQNIYTAHKCRDASNCWIQHLRALKQDLILFFIIFSSFSFYEQLNFRAQFSCSCKIIITMGPGLTFFWQNVVGIGWRYRTFCFCQVLAHKHLIRSFHYFCAVNW